MKFLSNGIGELVLRKLGEAVDARIAVAFFNPSDEMLDVLVGIKKLKLVISEEFTINNPYKLEKLKSAELCSIPTDDALGKLHAKVLLVEMRDNAHWVLLGSANLTYPGMFSNQEACVVMESNDPADQKATREIGVWFDSLFRSARPLALDQAKLIFDARSRYRLEPRATRKPAATVSYWVLKTTEGPSGESHWPMFLEENAIAIGWKELPVDPSKVSDPQLLAALKNEFGGPDRSTKAAASQIRRFISLKEDDIVLICRGYAPNQRKDVHIHGIARVTAPFRDKARKRGDWRFKHDAVIQEIDLDLPKDIVASALRKDSLMQTIHDLDKVDFDRLASKLKEFGAHIEV